MGETLDEHFDLNISIKPATSIVGAKYIDTILVKPTATRPNRSDHNPALIRGGAVRRIDIVFWVLICGLVHSGFLEVVSVTLTHTTSMPGKTTDSLLK